MKAAETFQLKLCPVLSGQKALISQTSKYSRHVDKRPRQNKTPFIFHPTIKTYVSQQDRPFFV